MLSTPSSRWTALALVAVLFVSGCSGSGSTASTLDQRLLGVWATESGARYTLTANDDTYALDIVDYDDEVFEIVTVTWTDGVLAWTYEVPSTGYRVSEETIRIDADSFDVRWENQTGASGTETLTRVE